MTVTGLAHTIYAGDKWTPKFTLSGIPAGTDLGDYTIRFALSALVTDTNWSTTAAVTKATGGSGIAVTDEENDVCQVTLLNADTAALLGKYYMELEVVDGSSESVVVSTGVLTVLKNVTNA